MNLLALDLSLAATGWATGRSSTITAYGTEKAPGRLRGVDRLAAWQDWLDKMTVLGAVDGIDFAIIEGYAFGRPHAMAGIAEWGGVARLTLHRLGIPFVEIPPATLKKYATGKGNATKSDMRMALYKRAGLDVKDDNQVDALWLLATAQEIYVSSPLWKMPKENVDVLGKIDWPEPAR